MPTLKRKEEFYIRSYKPEMKFLAKCKNITVVRIYGLLKGKLRFGYSNCVFVTQNKIADLMFLDRSNISRGLSFLVKESVVKKTKNGYMLSPWMVFIGSEIERKQAKGRWSRL